jgi:DNA-binding NarL/FixJ family response regulator
MTQTLIVTDQTMFGQAWADFLMKRHLAAQVATCSTPLAVELTARSQPKMIILDMQSVGIEEQQLITTLKSAARKARIVLILSGHESRTIIQYLINNGVIGLLSRQSSIEDFCLCTHSIEKRQLYIATELHQIFKKRLGPGERMHTGICFLSKKELEIAKLIVNGLSSKQIAFEMGLSYKTIEVHRYNIFKKLKLKNRIGLINLFTGRQIIL